MRRVLPEHALVAAGAGAYAGINLAALLAAIEFGVQPLLFHDAAGQALYCPYPLSVSIPAMMVGHLTLFGFAEVVFTAAHASPRRKAISRSAASRTRFHGTSCASAQARQSSNSGCTLTISPS